MKKYKYLIDFTNILIPKKRTHIYIVKELFLD